MDRFSGNAVFVYNAINQVTTLMSFKVNTLQKE